MNYHFVDKILELEHGKAILSQKSISRSEDYFDEFFPRLSCVPNSLIIESLAYSAALLAFVTTEFRSLALLLMVDDAKFERPVLPGDQMLLEVKLLSLQDTAGLFQGTVRVRGDLVAQATVMLGLFYLSDITDPADRDIFSSLLQRTADFVREYTI
jgi:3-hydroxymyristoyl/3-hydroxydecanoyl-(acyl carrier protein) dehydratase